MFQLILFELWKCYLRDGEACIVKEADCKFVLEKSFFTPKHQTFLCPSFRRCLIASYPFSVIAVKSERASPVLQVSPTSPKIGQEAALSCQQENASIIILTIYGDIYGSFFLQNYKYHITLNSVDHTSKVWRKFEEVKVYKDERSLRITFTVRESDRVRVRCLSEVRTEWMK